jgi:hypothetical protein
MKLPKLLIRPLLPFARFVCATLMPAFAAALLLFRLFLLKFPASAGACVINFVTKEEALTAVAH